MVFLVQSDPYFEVCIEVITELRCAPSNAAANLRVASNVNTFRWRLRRISYKTDEDFWKPKEEIAKKDVCLRACMVGSIT